MMIRRQHWLAAWGILGLLAQSRTAGAQAQKAALLGAEKTISELSRDSGFARAAARGLHSNAILLWPGAPVVVGTTDLRRLLSAFPMDSLQLTWQPLAAELSKDSSLGVTWGVAVAGARVGPASPQIGRYIAVWQRDGSRWAITALVFIGIAIQGTGLPKGLPLTRPAIAPSGSAAAFVAADLGFARTAADSGAGVAFERWAAPEAVVSGGRGLLTRGPEAIGRAVAGPAAWRWHPVAAGAAGTGDLGWTVGEATIVPQTGETSHSKYLTVWIRGANGDVRFLTDGGNARPAAP